MNCFCLAWNPCTGWFRRFLVFLLSNEVVDADLGRQTDRQTDMKTRKQEVGSGKS